VVHDHDLSSLRSLPSTLGETLAIVLAEIRLTIVSLGSDLHPGTIIDLEIRPLTVEVRGPYITLFRLIDEPLE
jgi:hypothetical protein